MPTHVHLLIEAGETNLSKVMHRLQFRYTRNFNLKYRTWGHLFQGRYKAILCDSKKERGQPLTEDSPSGRTMWNVLGWSHPWQDRFGLHHATSI